ncbi:hypothetical protein COBT_000391 [Conglomerata obtusa]
MTKLIIINNFQEILISFNYNCYVALSERLEVSFSTQSFFDNLQNEFIIQKIILSTNKFISLERIIYNDFFNEKGNRKSDNINSHYKKITSAYLDRLFRNIYKLDLTEINLLDSIPLSNHELSIYKLTNKNKMFEETYYMFYSSYVCFLENMKNFYHLNKTEGKERIAPDTKAFDINLYFESKLQALNKLFNNKNEYKIAVLILYYFFTNNEHDEYAYCAANPLFASYYCRYQCYIYYIAIIFNTTSPNCVHYEHRNFRLEFSTNDILDFNHTDIYLQNIVVSCFCNNFASSDHFNDFLKIIKSFWDRKIFDIKISDIELLIQVIDDNNIFTNNHKLLSSLLEGYFMKFIDIVAQATLELSTKNKLLYGVFSANDYAHLNRAKIIFNSFEKIVIKKE